MAFSNGAEPTVERVWDIILDTAIAQATKTSRSKAEALQIETAYTLRRATQNDVPAICAIGIEATAKFATIESLAHLLQVDDITLEKVSSWLESGPVCVVEAEGTEGPVGSIAAYIVDKALYVREVSVQPLYQGKGIGGALMDVVVECATRVGRIVSLTTYADGVPWNGPWYRRRGFKEVAAETLGPGHVEVLAAEKGEGDLERPGFRRCCMAWGDGNSGGYLQRHEGL